MSHWSHCRAAPDAEPPDDVDLEEDLLRALFAEDEEEDEPSLPLFVPPRKHSRLLGAHALYALYLILERLPDAPAPGRQLSGGEVGLLRSTLASNQAFRTFLTRLVDDLRLVLELAPPAPEGATA